MVSERIGRLEEDLLADKEFRRQVEARYLKVAERATTLDELTREAPSWFPEEPWWPPSRRQRFLLAAAVVWPVGFSILLASQLLPVTWLQVLVVVLATAGMYHLEPLTRRFLRFGLPTETWARLQWGPSAP